MRAALIGVLSALPVLAAGSTPVSITERQVATLEFAQPVKRLAVSDPEALGLKASGGTVKVTGLRAGKVQLEVLFADGSAATFDVSVAALRRPEGRPPAPDEVFLEVGEERVVPSPRGAQVLLEDNGVARATQDSRGVIVRGVAPGTASLVVVDPAGPRSTWKVRVR
jgi:hypothetical protein